MPKVYFKFPGGANHTIDDTLAGKIPQKLFDMYPLPYYEAAAEDRAWKGRPSVTGISSNGPRETFLRYVVPYAVDLDNFSNAFAGIERHSKFESDSPTKELYIATEEISGRLDNLEERPDGELWLIDYKLVGSFAYRMFKGITLENVPSTDEFGTPQFFKSGDKKGIARTHKVPVINPEKADIKKYVRQLNMYRYLVEQELVKGLPGLEHLKDRKIDRLKVFFQIRDGGVRTASINGVEGNAYLEDIPFVPDDKVLAFIQKRGAMVTNAVDGYLATNSPLEQNVPALKMFAPPVCDSYDAWEGRKCRDYCPVSFDCKRLEDNPWL